MNQNETLEQIYKRYPNRDKFLKEISLWYSRKMQINKISKKNLEDKLYRNYPERSSFVIELEKLRPELKRKSIENKWYVYNKKNAVIPEIKKVVIAVKRPRTYVKSLEVLYNKFPKKSDFIRELKKLRPEIKYKTLLNRWYEFSAGERTPVVQKVNGRYMLLYKKYFIREDFLRVAQEENPEVSRKTIVNNWSRCRRLMNKSRVQKYSADDKKEPNNFKKLELADMKKYKKPITREFLSRYGFTNLEINFLIDSGDIEEE